MNGTVKWFNSAGFGHIVGDDKVEYYVHYTSIATSPQTLKGGQRVTFVPAPMPSGTPNAEEVKVIG